jgi:hypothetical protein
VIDDANTVRNSRWRRNTSAVIVTIMLMLFVYGLVRFPDAPLHSCVDHGYCGKQGQPHTDYLDSSEPADAPWLKKPIATHA